MNINKTPTPSWYVYTVWAVRTYTKQMSVMSFLSFEFLKLAISFFRIKAKNALCNRSIISLIERYKYTFLLEHDALFPGVFLPLPVTWCKNIEL